MQDEDKGLGFAYSLCYNHSSYHSKYQQVELKES
jgi:hypothetical protein